MTVPFLNLNPNILQNFDISGLRRWRAALARQASGGGFAKIAFIGDSVTAGAISNASAVNYRANSYVRRVADNLTTAGMPAIWSNAFGANAGTQSGGNPPGHWDSRLSGTGQFSTVQSSLFSLGIVFTVLGAAGTLSFASGESTDTCDVWYIDQTGTFDINIDGGATITTVTMGGTLLVKKVTVSYAAGVHTVNVVWGSGNWSICGFDAYTVGTPSIHVFNIGSGGHKMEAFADDSTTYKALPALQALAADLVLVSFGINDWLASTNLTDFAASLQKIITGMVGISDIVIQTPTFTANSVVPLTTQELYIDVMKNKAVTNNIPYMDVRSSLVSWESMSSFSEVADNNHPNAKGHYEIGRTIANTVLVV